MRTSVDLPDALLRAAKARAVADGETLKDFLARAVTRELQTVPAPRSPSSRVSFPLIGATDRPAAEVTNADIAELLADDDAEKYGQQ